MNAHKFSLMGKVVTVSALYKRSVETRLGREFRFWKAEKITPRAGWVTGYRYLQNGFYNPGFGGYSNSEGWYESEPPHLSNIEVVPCLLVVYYPTMFPVKVPMDSVKIGGNPLSSSGAYSWSDRDRQMLKETMQNVPRDSKGRWLKC